jgi:YfiH family protein
MTLEILTSDALSPLRHGFFTRRGGASSGVFSGLNCGLGSSDQSDVVTINRGRVAQAMQVTPDRLIGVHQVHSADVVTLSGPILAPGTRADALVTDQPGLALAVLTADCMPVLLADPDAGIIAAVHAGWRGALAGILEATVAAMEQLGAERDAVVAVIGPCISQRAYEVGPELLAAFEAEDPDHAWFFANGTGDRLMFNLPGFGLSQLRAAGVGHAEWTGHCTYGQPDLFYSYRRSVHANEADYGRLLSAIRL